MKRINNEQGAALIYVVMISMILTIFITGILMMTSTTQLSDIKSEAERKVTSLAVSEMQALLQVPGTEANKLTFLKNSSNYGYTGASIQLVEGGSITSRQYLVPFGTSNVLNSSNVVAQNAIDDVNTKYTLVTTATFGDPNNNQIQDAGEKSFLIKKLFRSLGLSAPSSLKAITSFSLPSQTGPAIIDPTNRNIQIEVASGTNLSNLIASFTKSTGATVKVGTTTQTSGISANNFTNSLTTPFKYTVIAEDLTTNNWVVVVTVAGGAGSSGIVWTVDSNGNSTPSSFSSSMTSTDKLVITSSVGASTTASLYDLRADKGITIEPGVSFTTTSGTTTDISLYSSEGSITVSGTSLKSTGTSDFSGISIFAALDVDIRGATIDGKKNALFTAGRNILAQNAIITIQNPLFIMFTIQSPDPSKILYVDGLHLNIAATAGQSGVQICGRLAAGSSTINGFNNFTGGYCN